MILREQDCGIPSPFYKVPTDIYALQFGMLIEFLFEKFPNWEDANDLAIENLQVSRKSSRIRWFS